MSNNFILRSFDFRLSYLCKSEHSLRSCLKRGCLKLMVSFNQEKIKVFSKSRNLFVSSQGYLGETVEILKTRCNSSK